MWTSLRPVLRTLTAERRQVRAWSAPCADGREPYSMAMLAHDDEDIGARRLSITGTDIDQEALAAARRGVYETTRTTDIGEELALLSDAHTYVDQEGDQFRVRDRIKQMVDFERHDLIRDGAKAGFDLVLCRNLLIYIDTAYKQEIFDTITDSIRPGGYLVIGMTESLPAASRKVFDPVDKRRRIYQKA
jgi:chemotaxis protein methyltransferase CheR